MSKELDGAIGSFLMLTWFFLPTSIILSITEGLFTQPFINRYVWIGIAIGLVAYSAVWLALLYYKCWTSTKSRYLYRYFTFVLSFFVQNCLFAGIIIPVGFSTGGITDERFKDYVLLYCLTSALPIVSGTYVGIASMR